MGIDIFKKKVKCPTCGESFLPEELTHELRMNTSEGVHTIEICESCADFFDKSAQVLQQARERDDGETDPI